MSCRCLRRVECRSGCVEIPGDELGAGDSVVIGSGIDSMGMGLGTLGEVGEVDCEFGSVIKM